MSAEKLEEVLTRIDAVVAAGGVPLVIFDLDGTLLDNRPRTIRILREFAAEYGDGALSSVVEGLSADDFRYDVRDLLRARGWDDADGLEAFFSFWWERFFTDGYVLSDRATAGAVAFAGACWERGAVVYYLTGRHVGGMEQGTAASLTALGFPMYRGRVVLHLKPSFDVGDAEFKDAAVADIRSMRGPVIASFENEPGHANLLAESFPDAASFLVDTGHGPSAPAPSPALIHIDDFAT